MTKSTSVPVEKAVSEVQVILMRNASETDLAKARAERIGTFLPREGYRLVICGVILDDLKRLIGLCRVSGGSL